MKINISFHVKNFFFSRKKFLLFTKINSYHRDDEHPNGGTYRDNLPVTGARQAAKARRINHGAKAPVLFYFILAN